LIDICDGFFSIVDGTIQTSAITVDGLGVFKMPAIPLFTMKLLVFKAKLKFYMSQRSNKIIVFPSSLGGRGVMAIDDIAKDEIIEVCPVLVIPPKDVPNIHQSVLHDYYFTWGDDEKEAAIALGYGSLYNHATFANAIYEMDFEAMTIDIYACRDIKAGEEIFINYHGSPGAKDQLWFTDDMEDAED